MANVDAPLLLLVDDDTTLRERLAKALRSRGFEVQTAANHAEAMTQAKKEVPEFAVVDLRMPGPSGLEVVRDLHTLDATTRIVVLTGFGSIATTVEAMRLGAVHYLQKPADADEIVAALNQKASRATSGDLEVPSLERVKWEHINRVLSECGGNVSEAARSLGMHRRSLQRILQKYPPSR